MKEGVAFAGTLYRALNPVWAHKPLSGEGAARLGGRFNPRGVVALYCSLDPLTALRESNQVGDLQPTTLVAYRAAIERVFRGDDGAAPARFGMTAQDLADSGWRVAMHEDGEAPTQRFARGLIERGFNGLITPSFARGVNAEARNLVLWRCGEAEAVLEPIDEEGRLGH